MRELKAIGYFILTPVLTLAILAMSLVAEEPYPTLLMPGFSSANDLDEIETIDRKVFVIGSAEAQVRVSVLEFAQIDFTQSQASPIINGILREAPDLDPELAAWVHARLASLVSQQLCGEPVSVRIEHVALPVGDPAVVERTEVSHDLGVLQCAP